jgi:phage gpG-like protein
MAQVRVDVDAGGPLRMMQRAVTALSEGNVRNALREGARVFLVGIRSRAPRRTGRLANSFYIAPTSGTEYEVASNLIYAPVHEYGAVITPKRARVLHFFVGNEEVFAKRVEIPARPYVLPTFESDSGKAFDAFADRVEREI